MGGATMLSRYVPPCTANYRGVPQMGSNPVGDATLTISAMTRDEILDALSKSRKSS